MVSGETLWRGEFPADKVSTGDSAEQSQKAVAAYLKSKQLLPFSFVMCKQLLKRSSWVLFKQAATAFWFFRAEYLG